MAKPPALPVEVHDHFRKANVLHTYVQKDLGEAASHALETGQELLAAKAAIPHQRWQDECTRLFDGSIRTAQFYMQFSRDMGSLKSAQKSALLMLEGTLDGAAKAARKAAIAAGGKPAPKRPPSPSPPAGDPFEPPESPDTASEPEGTPESPKPPRSRRAKRDDKLEPCPNCRANKWSDKGDGLACDKCHHPYGEPAGDVDEDRIKTQRQKTVKTAEALQRAFDDLQAMIPKLKHGEAIRMCAELLKIAKGWK